MVCAVRVGNVDGGQMKRDAKGRFMGKPKPQHSIGGKQTRMEGSDRPASQWGTAKLFSAKFGADDSFIVGGFHEIPLLLE